MVPYRPGVAFPAGGDGLRAGWRVSRRTESRRAKYVPIFWIIEMKEKSCLQLFWDRSGVKFFDTCPEICCGPRLRAAAL
jgi:hypothetical protein